METFRVLVVNHSRTTADLVEPLAPLREAFLGYSRVCRIDVAYGTGEMQRRLKGEISTDSHYHCIIVTRQLLSEALEVGAAKSIADACIHRLAIASPSEKILKRDPANVSQIAVPLSRSACDTLVRQLIQKRLTRQAANQASEIGGVPSSIRHAARSRPVHRDRRDATSAERLHCADAPAETSDARPRPVPTLATPRWKACVAIAMSRNDKAELLCWNRQFCEVFAFSGPHSHQQTVELGELFGLATDPSSADLLRSSITSATFCALFANVYSQRGDAIPSYIRVLPLHVSAPTNLPDMKRSSKTMSEHISMVVFDRASDRGYASCSVLCVQKS